MTANLSAAQQSDGGTEGGISLFGMTLTSKVLGIGLAVIGVGLAGYGVTQFVIPKNEEIQNNTKSIEAKKTSVADLDKKLKSKGDVNQRVEAANVKNKYVLSLLPSVDSIDTLVRDINAQVPKTIVVSLPPFSFDLEGTLQEFTPKGVVDTAQYRTYSYGISFDSTFPEMLKTIQNIERLKPLLIVKDLTLTKKAIPPDLFKLPGNIPEDKKKQILDNFPPVLTTKFTLIAYVPFTDAERKAAEAAAAPKK
jgi:type IV pilus assembly protein PilO